MRRWLLVLLIALLPLRAWLGEAMAADMLAQHAAPVAAQQSASAHGAAGDCAGHHAKPGDAGSAAGPQAQSGEGLDAANCAACQVCSTMALAFRQPQVSAPDFGAAPPVPAAFTFASAEPAPADKPPIS